MRQRTKVLHTANTGSQTQAGKLAIDHIALVIDGKGDKRRWSVVKIECLVKTDKIDSWVSIVELSLFVTFVYSFDWS